MMRYCVRCAGPLLLRTPEGDTQDRYVCRDCGHVHYLNPKIVTGCIPEVGNRLLLCRRAIRPAYGKWTLPAGFMELGESATEAACRETREEALAQVEILSLFSLFSLRSVDQVYLMFRARLLAEGYGPGEESLDVGLFDESEIPWDEIAFPVIRENLHRYFADRNRGDFRTHVGTLPD